MSYYCKGLICKRKNECLRVEAYNNFKGSDNTPGLWFVHEETCQANNYEDGVFSNTKALGIAI